MPTSAGPIAVQHRTSQSTVIPTSGCPSYILGGVHGSEHTDKREARKPSQAHASSRQGSRRRSRKTEVNQTQRADKAGGQKGAATVGRDYSRGPFRARSSEELWRTYALANIRRGLHKPGAHAPRRTYALANIRLGEHTPGKHMPMRTCAVANIRHHFHPQSRLLEEGRGEGEDELGTLELQSSSLAMCTCTA